MVPCSKAAVPSLATSTAYACSRRPFASTVAATGSSSTTRILNCRLRPRGAALLPRQRAGEARECTGLALAPAFAGDEHAVLGAERHGLSLRFLQRGDVNHGRDPRLAVE